MFAKEALLTSQNLEMLITKIKDIDETININCQESLFEFCIRVSHSRDEWQWNSNNYWWGSTHHHGPDPAYTKCGHDSSGHHGSGDTGNYSKHPYGPRDSRDEPWSGTPGNYGADDHQQPNCAIAI
ncbi:UNVERIFIED_CONTAM: hypothetical protein K2H54_056943 [Gekko kuhli]